MIDMYKRIILIILVLCTIACSEKVSSFKNVNPFDTRLSTTSYHDRHIANKNPKQPVLLSIPLPQTRVEHVKPKETVQRTMRCGMQYRKNKSSSLHTDKGNSTETKSHKLDTNVNEESVKGHLNRAILKNAKHARETSVTSSWMENDAHDKNKMLSRPRKDNTDGDNMMINSGPREKVKRCNAGRYVCYCKEEDCLRKASKKALSRVPGPLKIDKPGKLIHRRPSFPANVLQRGLPKLYPENSYGSHVPGLINSFPIRSYQEQVNNLPRVPIIYRVPPNIVGPAVGSGREVVNAGIPFTPIRRGPNLFVGNNIGNQHSPNFPPNSRRYPCLPANENDIKSQDADSVRTMGKGRDRNFSMSTTESWNDYVGASKARNNNHPESMDTITSSSTDTSFGLNDTISTDYIDISNDASTENNTKIDDTTESSETPIFSTVSADSIDLTTTADIENTSELYPSSVTEDNVDTTEFTVDPSKYSTDPFEMTTSSWMDYFDTSTNAGTDNTIFNESARDGENSQMNTTSTITNEYELREFIKVGKVNVDSSKNLDSTTSLSSNNIHVETSLSETYLHTDWKEQQSTDNKPFDVTEATESSMRKLQKQTFYETNENMNDKLLGKSKSNQDLTVMEQLDDEESTDSTQTDFYISKNTLSSEESITVYDYDNLETSILPIISKTSEITAISTESDKIASSSFGNLDRCQESSITKSNGCKENSQYTTESLEWNTESSTSKLPFCDNTLLLNSIKKVINDFAPNATSIKTEDLNENILRMQGKILSPEVLQVSDIKNILSQPQIESTIVEKVKGILSDVTDIPKKDFTNNWSHHVIKNTLRSMLEALPSSQQRYAPITVEEHQFKKGHWVTNKVTLSPVAHGQVSTKLEILRQSINDLLGSPAIASQANQQIVRNIIVQSVKNSLNNNEENDREGSQLNDSVILDMLNNMLQTLRNPENTATFNEGVEDSTMESISTADTDTIISQESTLTVTAATNEPLDYTDKTSVETTEQNIIIAETKPLLIDEVSNRQLDTYVSSSTPSIDSTTETDVSNRNNCLYKEDRAKTKTEFHMANSTTESSPRYNEIDSTLIHARNDINESPINYYSPSNRIVEYIKNHPIDKDKENITMQDANLVNSMQKNPADDKKLSDSANLNKNAAAAAKSMGNEYSLNEIQPQKFTTQDVIKIHEVTTELQRTYAKTTYFGPSVVDHSKSSSIAPACETTDKPSSNNNDLILNKTMDKVNENIDSTTRSSSNDTFSLQLSSSLTNPENISQLQKSQLYYISDGIKLPLEIRQLKDGSYALSISRNICEQILKRKCPCCVPLQGQVVRSSRKIHCSEDPHDTNVENNYHSIDKSQRKSHILTTTEDIAKKSPRIEKSVSTRNNRERRNLIANDLAIISMPVTDFAKKYNLSLNFDEEETLRNEIRLPNEIQDDVTPLIILNKGVIHDRLKTKNANNNLRTKENGFISERAAFQKDKFQNSINTREDKNILGAKFENSINIGTDGEMIKISDNENTLKNVNIGTRLGKLSNIGKNKKGTNTDEMSNYEEKANKSMNKKEGIYTETKLTESNDGRTNYQRIPEIKAFIEQNGRPYRYQRNVNEVANKGTDVLKAMLYWLKNLLLDQ